MLYRGAILSSCLFGFSVVTAYESLNLDPPPLAQIDRDAEEVVDDRQVVVLARTSEEASHLLDRSRVRGYRLERSETLDALGLILLVLVLPPELSGEAAIRELESLAPGVTAGLNHGYRDQPIADAAEGRLYADTMVGWPPGGCRSDVSIGVIDAAIAPTDGEFHGAVLKVRDFTGGHTVEASHAMVTAQVIAGPGRLSGVQLYNAAVVGRHRLNEAAASVDAMSSALNWLARSNVRLVNISLAGPYNKILDRTVQAAVDRGMIIVAAAGNEGPDAPPRYPAAFDGVIAVTAIDAREQIYERAVRGPHIDFAAPGVDVHVHDDSGGRYVTGTSIAAPFVTARIAADIALSGVASAGEARKVLAATARDLGVAGHDPVFGSGLAVLRGGCRG